MWQTILQALADEIDNIFYFVLAIILIAGAVWLKPPDWVQGMITGLFAACLIKVKGGGPVSKIAGALKDVAGAGASKSPLGKIVGGVKDIID